MERPGVGLGVIIMRGGNEVLLGKRKGSHGAGTWECPGGHLEFYEKFKDCALREPKEETGLTDKNIEIIDEHPVAVTNDMFLADGKHYVTLFFRAKYISGEPKVMEDFCEQWGWFDWNDLPYPLFSGVQELKERGYNPFEK